MSLSETKETQCKTIPTRRVLINSPSQLPGDYCTTPGGTHYSTTPGGTRLIYDRKFLMKCRESPLAKSPPVILNEIPGITCSGDATVVSEKPVKLDDVVKEGKENTEELFEMDI